MYIDAQDFHLSGEEMYDMGGKLWKLDHAVFPVTSQRIWRHV